MCLKKPPQNVNRYDDLTVDKPDGQRILIFTGSFDLLMLVLTG